MGCREACTHTKKCFILELRKPLMLNTDLEVDIQGPCLFI